MADSKNQTALSPEEKDRRVIYDDYIGKAYWTFKLGMDLVILPTYDGDYPIQFVIDEDLFEDILQAVETGDLETINTPEQIRDIVDFATFDEPAELEKHCKEKPGQKFYRFEVIKEKQNYFYKKIKIKPVVFIKYIKENFDRFSDIEIPPELEGLVKKKGADQDNGGKKLRPDQEDKIECQKIAKEVWKEYEDLDIKHLKKHPKIKKISGSANKFYKETTIHRWLSEVAPENAKKRGKRPKEIREEQNKICEEIGIKM